MIITQIACGLCAVPTKLARIRTQSEPPEAAWDTGTGIPAVEDIDICDANDCEKVVRACDYWNFKDNIDEHIAGPNCTMTLGYNGNAISADEMKYCNTQQFIVRYDSLSHEESQDRYVEELDDEDFERDGMYHLSGLGSRCGCDKDDCSVYPNRHAVEVVDPHYFGGFSDEGLGEPSFHPYCLEMYRRVSQLRLGRADLSGLAEWIEHEGHLNPFHYLSESPSTITQQQTEAWGPHGLTYQETSF